ncbi:acetate--CoA ligase family protein [Pseudooceanicola sp.]|uniref:acetate--CoA ligase family protein n=1 Tax=Pseudooceanicola sp. TaxID=1914328 RepID=UPI0026188525|nr:acetate--CoA ligase family protein [Pseudooceanicola sp.]MDF1854622.1 acetate--CoA ligase family protein [Pseudooceanicola sp.]
MLIDNFLNPGSVVIYGASTDPKKMGGRVLANMLSGGYPGQVYVIHPKADIVQGLTAYKSTADLPATPDTAVLCIPSNGVEPALRDCAALGVKSAIILSAGFGEEGEEGKAAQARIKAIAKDAGMRFSGPNSLGCISAVHKFSATFSGYLMENTPKPGHVGIITQSGALGTHVMGRAFDMGLGLSHGIFCGNEGDLEAADFIEAMAADPETHVICAALEACNDGPKLRRALLAAAMADKPVFICKVGRSEVGAQAALSHTGRMAGNDSAFSAVFEASGAVRVRSIEDMLEFALVTSVAGRPENDRVGILTISGGAGIIAADAADDIGLDTPPVRPETGKALHDIYALCIGANPIDTTANVGTDISKAGALLEAMAKDGQYGTIYLYLAFIGRGERIAKFKEHVIAVKNRYPELSVVLSTFLSDEYRPELHAAGIADVLDPDRAIRASAGAWQSRKLQAAARAAASDSTAPALPAAAFAGGDEVAAKAYLAEAGLRGPAETLCQFADEAVAAAKAIGWPVVAKIVSEDLPHKTEIGGVVLNLRDEAALRAAYDGILTRAKAAKPDARIAGISVIEQVEGGVEMIVGGSQDANFGPMVMVGLGGTAAELFHDVALAPAPVSPEQAREMVLSTRASALLTGWRGGPAMDLEALAQAVSVVSHLVADPKYNVAEIDINPFRLKENGGLVLDALIGTHN